MANSLGLLISRMRFLSERAAYLLITFVTALFGMVLPGISVKIIVTVAIAAMGVGVGLAFANQSYAASCALKHIEKSQQRKRIGQHALWIGYWLVGVLFLEMGLLLVALPFTRLE